MVQLNSAPFFLGETDIDWIEKTLSSMSLEEKVGQLFCVNYREGTEEELDYTYKVLSPGACMFRRMPYSLIPILQMRLYWISLSRN